MSDIRKLTVLDLRAQLAELESQLSMSPREFYDRFRAGELGDGPEVMKWVGLCYMAERNGVLASTPAYA